MNPSRKSIVFEGAGGPALAQGQASHTLTTRGSDNGHPQQPLTTATPNTRIGIPFGRSTQLLYTGHCPTLKFRFGKRYGANTKEIIQEMGERGMHLHRQSGEPYLHSMTQQQQQQNSHHHQQHNGPSSYQPVSAQRVSQMNAVPPPETSSHRDHNGATFDHSGHSDPHRSRRFILGYTGYIPGLNFRYGKSFERAADDSVAEFGRRLREQDDRREKDRNHRARSAPKTFSSRPREQVRSSMREYEEKNRYKGEESRGHLDNRWSAKTRERGWRS